MLKEFFKIWGVTSGDSETEVFLDAKRPVRKSEGKKTKSFYS